MINCIGQMFGSSGYANHFRYLVNALNKLTECRIATNPYPGFERDINDQELEMIKRKEDYEINLIITHPVNWKSNLGAKRNWVYLIWEGDRVPEWILKECMNDNIEKIICPSQHTKNALMNTDQGMNHYFENKVVIIPHGVDQTRFYPINSQVKKDKDDGSNVSLSGNPKDLQGKNIKEEHVLASVDNQPDTFQFLMNKGFRNLEDRGGVQYGIKAYLEEFTNKDNVELIVKINPAYGIPNLSEMFPVIKKDSPKITFITEDYTKEQLNQLYNRCDVFVSSTRAEAFNLPCLEAMACGKPVLATNFGGQTDFIEDEVTGWLVDYDLVEVEHEVEYEGIKWAIPKHEDLMVKMRTLYETPELTNDNSKCIETAKKMTWDKTAEQIVSLQ